MKILLTFDLEAQLIDQIGAVGADVEVLSCQSQEQIAEVVEQVEIVFGGFDPDLYSRAKKLRWIQFPSAGVDGALTPECVASDVIITSAKGNVGVHLAEHAMALLLALTRGLGTAIRARNWTVKMAIRNRSWELPGRVMGIVGLGGTGRELATRAAAFGMNVIAVDPESMDLPACVEACWGMDRLQHLLERADVVAICAPLTAETEGFFDLSAFNHMQSHALLLNVTRGKIVDEHALVEALETGSIGGAGLDVTPQEPLPDDHPLWQMENVVITPHTAGASPERNRRTTDLFCENLRRYRSGEPLLAVIDKSKGY